MFSNDGVRKWENMRNEAVYEEYSEDKMYRFVVYRNEDLFEVWVQKRFTDEYMGEDWFDYEDIRDVMHYADTLERAKEIGRECLRCCI